MTKPIKRSRPRRTLADYKEENAELKRRLLEQQAAAQIISILNEVERKTGIPLVLDDYQACTGPGCRTLKGGDLSWITKKD